MNEQPDAGQVLDGIGEALEARGYAHMTNGKSIGDLLDELEALRAQSDAAEAIAAEIRKKPEFKEMVAQAHALVQPDAEPKGIDLDDVDRAYDKWAEHRNGHSRLDAFRAGVEFGLRHTVPPRPDASAGLIEAAELTDVSLYSHHSDPRVVLHFRRSEEARHVGKELQKQIRSRAADRSGK